MKERSPRRGRKSVALAPSPALTPPPGATTYLRPLSPGWRRGLGPYAPPGLQTRPRTPDPWLLTPDPFSQVVEAEHNSVVAAAGGPEHPRGDRVAHAADRAVAERRLHGPDVGRA